MTKTKNLATRSNVNTTLAEGERATLRRAEDPVRVLVVDDEQDIREIILHLLGKLDCEVVQAVDGNEALALLRSRPFDLMATDESMPDFRGTDLIRAVNLEFPHVLCMIISGNWQPETLSSALAMNVFDFIDKPFEDAHLLVRFRRAFEFVRIRRAENELLAALFRALGRPGVPDLEHLSGTERLATLQALVSIVRLRSLRT